MDDVYLTVPMVYTPGLATMFTVLAMLVVIKIAAAILSWLDHVLPF